MDGANIKARIVLDTSEVDRIMGISGGPSSNGSEDPNNPNSTKGLLKGLGTTFKSVLKTNKEGNELLKLMSLGESGLGLITGLGALGTSIGLGAGTVAGQGALGVGVGEALVQEFGAGGTVGEDVLDLDSAEVVNQGMGQLADTTINVADATRDTGILIDERNQRLEQEVFPLDEESLTLITEIVSNQGDLNSNLERSARLWEEYNRILESQVIPSLSRVSPGSGGVGSISVGVTASSEVSDATDIGIIEQVGSFTPEQINVQGYNP